MYFSVERGKFIQILHTGHSHWVTIITDNTVDPCGWHVCVFTIVSLMYRAAILVHS